MMTVAMLKERLEFLDPELEVCVIIERQLLTERWQIEEFVKDLATTSGKCILIGESFER